MEIKINEIIIGKRCRKNISDIDSLVASIEEIGLLQPVVLTAEKKLIAGFRRIQAFQKLGKASIPCHIAHNLKEVGELLKAERDENTCRMPLNPEESVSMGEAIARIERPKAEAKHLEGTKKGGKTAGKGRPLNSSRKNFPRAKPKQDESARTLSVAAAAVGMSRPTFEKAKAVIEAAKKEPAKYRPLVDEMNRTGKVAGVAKKLNLIKTVEAIKQKSQPLPTGPFDIIVADPPWTFNKRAADATHRVSSPYPTMTIPEIAALPIVKMMSDNAILWLWTTNSHLPEVWPIITNWGFVYKTMLTWVKDRMGTGDWLRGQTEHCLMCVRGKPIITLSNQTTVIHGPLREHSRKPDEFYQLVEALCPGSKCELFSRQQRPGWIASGVEKELFHD